MSYDTIPANDVIERAVAALKANNINAAVVADAAAAKTKALELIPAGAQVMNMTSVTLETTGIADEIVKSGRHTLARDRLADTAITDLEKQQLGAAPEWAIGSVHAVTEDGRVMIASATGSQLPAYAYGSLHVLWVVGAQKIVKNLDEGFKRIYEYTFPLEDARARKAYGMGSGVNKVLIVNKEFKPGRITMILVKEALGF